MLCDKLVRPVRQSWIFFWGIRLNIPWCEMLFFIFPFVTFNLFISLTFLTIALIRILQQFPSLPCINFHFRNQNWFDSCTILLLNWDHSLSSNTYLPSSSFRIGKIYWQLNLCKLSPKTVIVSSIISSQFGHSFQIWINCKCQKILRVFQKIRMISTMNASIFHWIVRGPSLLETKF